MTEPRALSHEISIYIYIYIYIDYYYYSLFWKKEKIVLNCGLWSLIIPLYVFYKSPSMSYKKGNDIIVSLECSTFCLINHN